MIKKKKSSFKKTTSSHKLFSSSTKAVQKESVKQFPIGKHAGKEILSSWLIPIGQSYTFLLHWRGSLQNLTPVKFGSCVQIKQSWLQVESFETQPERLLRLGLYSGWSLTS